MPLDPELQLIVDLVNSVEVPPPAEQPVDELRAAFEGLVTMFGAGPEAVSAEDLVVPSTATDIPVRLYRAPDARVATDAGGATGASDEHGPLQGLLVFFHGGGWVIGTIDSHDALCREIAAGAGCSVLSAGYRLAPEHPYPAALDDCLAVTRWAAEHADELGVAADRIAVGGDSAGGQLAAVTALRAAADADSGLPELALQVLIYPVTDLSDYPLDGTKRHASLSENGTGYVLTAETMQFFADSYVPDTGDRSSADVSPLLADDLTGVAPALVITAEFDPLRDEGEAYAERLADAGVPTTATRYDGAIHMFLQMPATAIGRRGIDEVCAALRARLG